MSTHPATEEEHPEQQDMESPTPVIPSDEFGEVPPSDEVPNGMNRLKCKYSTTSSIYTTNTLVTPDSEQVLYCIGALLQAQLFDDHEAPGLHNTYPEFEIEVNLHPKYGGNMDVIPPEILEFETHKDEELRDKIVAGHVPTIDTIKRFFSMISLSARYSAQCNVIALIYINRITAKNKMALTMKNWRGLWVASIILAQKVWDDTPVRTSSFADILPGVTKQQLRAMEFKAFVLLDYSTQVKPSTYARYYFELRTLFHSIFPAPGSNPFALKPLTLVEGRRLEDKSTKASKKFRMATSPLDTRKPSELSPFLTSSSTATSSASSSQRGASSASPCKVKDRQHVTLEDATYTPGNALYVLRF